MDSGAKQPKLFITVECAFYSTVSNSASTCHFRNILISLHVTKQYNLVPAKTESAHVVVLHLRVVFG